MKSAPITVNAIAGSEPYRRVAVMRKLVEDGRLDCELLKRGALYDILKSKLDRLLENAPAAAAATTTTTQAVSEPRPAQKTRYSARAFSYRTTVTYFQAVFCP